MLKASALYIVIVIALVIALLCSALIMAASLYKAQYLVKERYNHLNLNLSSAINIIICGQDSSLNYNKTFSLFDNNEDFVTTRTRPWGIYDVHIAEAFKNRDTVFSVFTTGNLPDTTKKIAFYLADEDRPLALSGETNIQGNAFIPLAGVWPVYIDNETYKGDKKKLISGKQYNSERSLPSLNTIRLGALKSLFDMKSFEDNTLTGSDTIRHSFRDSILVIRLTQKNAYIAKKVFTGNIMLYSEGGIIIDSSVLFKNILIVAKNIIVKNGFRGKCQLFARDSITIGKNCRFDYPSAIGTLRFSNEPLNYPQQIYIGEDSILNGVLFTYEKNGSEIPSIIDLDKNVKIKGQVYAQKILQNQAGVSIYGTAYASRFMYLHGANRFENYLINIKILSDSLSKNYLTGTLLPAFTHQKKVLQWLEAKY